MEPLTTNERIKKLPAWVQRLIDEQQIKLAYLSSRLAMYESDQLLKDPRNGDSRTTGIAFGDRPTERMFVTVKEHELAIEGYGLLSIHPVTLNKIVVKPV